MKKLDGKSMDIVEQNIEQLKELFPEVFAEGKIKFNQLQELLGNYVVEDEDHYNFTWHGKRKAGRLAQTPSTGTLRPAKDESVDWDTTENLFIEGDNLEVLKLLQKSYHRKVKMIYIDPPYNTGNDFVYSDDFKDGIKNYLKMTGQVDSQGKKMGTNSSSAGRYHTNWLNMMYPRLKLARNLMCDDGVIFISIDDNESGNLRKLCDEVFGEENLLRILSVELTKTQGMKVKSAQEGTIVKNYEPVFCYAKDKSKLNKVSRVLYDKGELFDTHYNCIIENNKKESLCDFLLKNNDIREELYSLKLLKNEKLPIKNIEKALYLSDKFKKYIYEDISNIIYQETACEISLPTDIEQSIGYGDIVEYSKYLLTKSKGGNIRQYISLEKSLNTDDTYNPSFGRVTIRGDLWKGFYSDMMNVAKEGGVDFKNGKKPVRLIHQLAKWFIDNDDIVLDFFAGSGTTAQAVTLLNTKENINSRYILIQLPEKLNENIKEQKESFNFCKSLNLPTNVAEISKERIRRAAKKIQEENPDYKGDLGFKVFKLDSSNIKRWEADFDTLEQDLLNAVDYIKQDRSSDDVLYELLLKYGLDLTVPIETRTIAEKTVYSIGLGALVVCLDKDINMDVVNGIGALKEELNPEIMRVVFKDDGFKDDVVKTNALQTLKRYGIEDIKSL
ncbi:MAG: site-specific DNA-methyltransferase [Alphaproteobacteria bacterium]|nr:site-specific DNA-methyltransferase [Alphaproteobacteria bacterium]